MVVKKEKKGCLSGGVSPKLSKIEKEILHLLTNEHLTPNQIKIRRGTSQQAVSKHVANLRKKGYLKKSYSMVVNSQPTSQPFQPIRLHGQEFNIKILYKDERYKRIVAKGNVMIVDGNTVRLYRDSLEVYGTRSFFGQDPTHATSKSMEYWWKFFVSLENQLKVNLVKPRVQNISLVNSHYAEIKNEFAKECNDKGDKVSVYTTEEGKLWFEIDNSFNLNEAECLHPKTSKPDADRVVKHFNDLRDNEYVPLSQLSQYMADTSKQINEISHGVNALVTYLNSVLPKEKLNSEKVLGKPFYTG